MFCLNIQVESYSFLYFQAKEPTNGQILVQYMMETGNLGREMDLEHTVYPRKMEDIKNSTLVAGKMPKDM